MQNNVTRDKRVQALLENAFAVMRLSADHLELWCIADMAPLVRDSFPPNESRLMSVGLGPLTRNARTKLNVDHLELSIDGVTVVALPYDAIYCVATKGDYAHELNWVAETGTAFVNLVHPMHGLDRA